MAIDQVLVGQVAAELMEDLEKDPDYGEEAYIAAVALVVAVNENQQKGERTHCVHYCLSRGTPPEVGLKLLAEGQLAIQRDQEQGEA
jgi:hypothetical protein